MKILKEFVLPAVAWVVVVFGILWISSEEANAQPQGYTPNPHYLLQTDEEFCTGTLLEVFWATAKKPEEGVGIFNALYPYVERMEPEDATRAVLLLGGIQTALKHKDFLSGANWQQRREINSGIVEQCFKAVSEQV